MPWLLSVGKVSLFISALDELLCLWILNHAAQGPFGYRRWRISPGSVPKVCGHVHLPGITSHDRGVSRSESIGLDNIVDFQR